MTGDDSEDKRLSKFSRADRGAYSFNRPPDAAADPLAEALEKVMRGGVMPVSQTPEPPAKSQVPPAPQIIDSRLIEELHSAREQIRQTPPIEAPPPVGSAEDEAAPPYLLPIAVMPHAAEGFSARLRSVLARAGESVRHVRTSAGQRLDETRRAARQFLATGAKGAASSAAALSRRMRLKDWQRRRLALTSTVHRYVFDRRAERLLFCKTPPLEVYSVTQGEKGIEKAFVYHGPIARKVLDWALSALPQDLKRHAFVDFRAGNGRTLLLAARRNFEYAAGYAFDTEGCEILEMNLAQYPRSWLGCRDVRALRGDRDGLLIPSQPAVLFFADALPDAHLDIILSYVSASLRLDPRETWLIFENAGREKGREQMELFEKVPLPFASEVKLRLFSPVPIAVYRTKADSAAGAI